MEKMSINLRTKWRVKVSICVQKLAKSINLRTKPTWEHRPVKSFQLLKDT
jgi:hypothetical protein